jgi:deoxycytidylate deaminase
MMAIAVQYARWFSLDEAMPNATIIARGHRMISAGANGSDYHLRHGCVRRQVGSKTGEDYHLCEGCDPAWHSERRAIARARDRGVDIAGSDLYLWGHYGCCPPCWEAIIEAGVGEVYLVDRAEALFNQNHPDNIVGRQFEYFTISSTDCRRPVAT